MGKMTDIIYPSDILSAYSEHANYGDYEDTDND